MERKAEKKKKESVGCELGYIDYVMVFPNANTLLLNSKKRMK